MHLPVVQVPPLSPHGDRTSAGCPVVTISTGTDLAKAVSHGQRIPDWNSDPLGTWAAVVISVLSGPTGNEG